MKTLIVIIFLLALTYFGFSQISPAIKTGFGYVYVFDKDVSVSPDYHKITGYPTFSIEKPFPVEIKLKKRMSINPGFAYYYFKEERFKEYRDKVVKHTRDYNLNHQSVNAFVKVLYQAKFRGKTEAFIYGGGIAGLNFFTKTKGTKFVRGLNSEIPKYTEHVNENGLKFFERLYYGMLIGFQPNARRYNFIKPSFEFAFYPGFISKPSPTYVSDTNDLAQITYKDINTIQFTVFLGFRIK